MVVYRDHSEVPWAKTCQESVIRRFQNVFLFRDNETVIVRDRPWEISSALMSDEGLRYRGISYPSVTVRGDILILSRDIKRVCPKFLFEDPT